MAVHPLRGITDRLADLGADIESRTGLLVGLGLALTAAAVAVVVAVFVVFSGAFSSYALVTAQLPANSTAVPPGSGVEYRDVTVGKVVGEGRRTASGLVEVSLHLDPSKLRDIPADVAAQVEPVSIFGNQYVVLEAPSSATRATLGVGATIGPEGGSRTNSVQQTVGDLDDLLTELHPAQLDMALTAVAQALEGRGSSLGKTLDSASTYLAKMQPLWPTVEKDLALLSPVADNVTASVPAILAILSNSISVSQTVVSDSQQLDGLLTGGSSVASNGANVLTAIQQPFSVLVSAAGPLLADIGGNPEEISSLLSGLDGFAKAVVSAESTGPFLQATANVAVTNPANLALGALGGPDMLAQLAAALPAGIVDPPTYTAADCPTFGADRCGTAAAQSAATRTASAVTAAARAQEVLPEPAQTDAVATVAAALSGGHQVPSSTVASLLLTPVLQGMAQQ